MLISILGCKSITISNDTACHVGFDYTDTGVNSRNATALIRHFCICNPDNKDCGYEQNQQGTAGYVKIVKA